MSILDYAHMLAPTPRPANNPAVNAGYVPEWLFYQFAPPSSDPTPPASPDTPSSPAPTMASFVPDERGSQTMLGDTGPGGHSANVAGTGSFGSGTGDWLSVTPGFMSVPMTGLSYGTGTKKTGQMHDVGAWNPGDMIGSIAGGVTGIPGAGAIGGWLGGQVSPTFAAHNFGAMQRNGENVYAQDVVNTPQAYEDQLSSREMSDAESAMQNTPYVSPATGNPVPVMQGGSRSYTPTEAALRRAAGQGFQMGRPANWQPTQHMSARTQNIATGGQATAQDARNAGVPGAGSVGFSSFDFNTGQGQTEFNRANDAVSNMSPSTRSAVESALSREMSRNSSIW